MRGITPKGVAHACAWSAAVLALAAPPPAAAQQPWDESPAVEARVTQLLEQLTTEEKIDLATGRINNLYGFYNNPIERLDIPALTMADGPVGVRVANPAVNGQRATQLPSGTALGATWDTDLLRRVGQMVGDEAHATGHNTWLAPSVDIARTAQWGRAFEGFGEDPLLNGRAAAALIQGVQSRPVMATIKHFVVYDQETERFTIDARVSDRALREIYGKPFEIGIREARPGAAMCAFNKVNTVFACEHPLMNTLLKGDYGFRGFVMSDYNATPSTVRAALNGLDQEQPGDQGPGSANFGERLLAAVEAGEVPQARLDDMARRILRPMVGLGLFENRPTTTGFDERAHGQLAREVASAGMVLLKNRRNTLPLEPSRRLRSLAVIGPDADNASATGGGSSVVRPTYAVSPLEGIRARAGSRIAVRYAQGVDGISEGDLLPGPAPVPSSTLRPTDGAPGERGLRAEYFPNTTFSGAPALAQVDPTVNVNFGFTNFPGFNAASPKARTPVGNFALLGDLSARWSGTFTAPQTASYTLGLTARGDARLWFDGELVATHTGALSTERFTRELTAGEPHTVRIEYAAEAPNQYQGGQVRFTWEHAEDVLSPMMRDAVAEARNADAAVVVVRDYETEGGDRPHLDLPREQDQLIRRVSRANPNTVVVVETGAPSKTATWEEDVPAILQAWYPGQEQGNAIADVLFGAVNPSGKLVATIPVDEQRQPVNTPEQFPGVGGVAAHSEDIFVGYRGFRERNLQPQYAFGHGLSYTEFRYRRLRVADRLDPQGDIALTFRLRNVGDVPGAEVAQAYIGRLPERSVATPDRKLVGWAKVALAPGERREVTITVPRRELSYWDTGAQHWVTPSGRVPVYVGGSSEDAALAGVIEVRPSSIAARAVRARAATR